MWMIRVTVCVTLLHSARRFAFLGGISSKEEEDPEVIVQKW